MIKKDNFQVPIPVARDKSHSQAYWQIPCVFSMVCTARSLQCPWPVFL